MPWVWFQSLTNVFGTQRAAVQSLHWISHCFTSWGVLEGEVLSQLSSQDHLDLGTCPASQGTNLTVETNKETTFLCSECLLIHASPPKGNLLLSIR